MFNRIKHFLVGAEDAPQNERHSSLSPCSPGYHSPQPIDVLIASALRQSLLQQLSDNHALPAAFYRQCYLAPLFSLLNRVQNLPASKDGDWAYAGAFGDLTMKFVTYSVRLAKGRTLPPGIPPEEQAAQGLLWNAVVFWSALFYHLPLLCEWEGELEGGECWIPGFTLPGKPFRFRHRVDKLPPSYAQGRVALLAGQLLPASALTWLSTIPDAFDCLAQRMLGRPATISLIDELLLSAAEKCGAPSLNGMMPPSILPVPVPEGIEPSVMPPEPLMVSALTSALPENNPATVVSDDALCPQPEALPQATLVLQPSIVPVLDSVMSAHSEPMADKQLTGSPATEPVQNDTQALLSLFSAVPLAPKSDIEAKPDNIAIVPDETKITKEDENATEMEPTSSAILPTENIDGVRDDNNKGSVFFEWLSAGLINSEITVNEEGSRVHIVAGFVFLCVPEIFFLFQKVTGNKIKRNVLQASFERMGMHRVANGQRFMQARIYSNPSGTGSYQNINGYLVKASTLYRGNSIPGESALLILP